MELMRNITIGQFTPGISIVHRLDSRIKIFLTFILMVAVFLIKNFTAALLFTGFLAVMVIASGISINYIIRGLKSIYFLLFLTFFFNLFTPGAQVIYDFGFIKITYEGLHYSVIMCSRIIYLVVITSLLTLTTSPLEITDAIENLLLPFKKIKIPAHEIAIMLTISLRFIPTLISEAEKIIKAQAARGLQLDQGNIFKRVKNFVPILVPLFIHTFKCAEDLAIAMEARCYRTGFSRTRMKELKVGLLDLMSVLITGVILIVILNYN